MYNISSTIDFSAGVSTHYNVRTSELDEISEKRRIYIGKRGDYTGCITDNDSESASASALGGRRCRAGRMPAGRRQLLQSNLSAAASQAKSTPYG